MSDEVEFYKAIKLAENFLINKLRVKIFHPTLPGCYLEVDNLAQKGKTVFVFEGKSINDGRAIRQLKDRNNSLILFNDFYIKICLVYNFNSIRLFYYSFKSQVISEFNINGNKIFTTKFNNLKELALILRNL